MGDQNLLVMVIEEILIFPFLVWEVASFSNYFPLQGPPSASLDQHPVFFLLGFGTWVPPLKKPCWASLFQPQASRDAKPEEPGGVDWLWVLSRLGQEWSPVARLWAHGEPQGPRRGLWAFPLSGSSRAWPSSLMSANRNNRLGWSITGKTTKETFLWHSSKVWLFIWLLSISAKA